MDLSGVRRTVTVPVPVDSAGRLGPTPNDTRTDRSRRTSRGLYVPAAVDGTSVDQRVVEAAAVLPDEYGAVTGWAALGWAGGRWFDGVPWGGGPVRPVVLAVGGNRAIRPQASFATSEERLRLDEQVMIDGIRLTIHPRSVCFEMRYARSARLAVVFLDMAAFSDLVSIAEVVAYAGRIPGWTGIPQCRAAIPLASENSWSPQETLMRLIWILDARLAIRLLCNVPIFDTSGRHLGTPDLLDPVAGVVGEYDGFPHLAGSRRVRDEGRQGLFRSSGLEYVTMLAEDHADTSRFIGRLVAAYERAAVIPESRRTWTLERPHWWIDTSTVAARRALTAWQRARLLRHRAA